MSTADIDPIVRDLITERHRRGWTRQGAAQRAGISYRAVASWERGERQPSLDKLRAYVEAYGWSLAHRPLLGGAA